MTKVVHDTDLGSGIEISGGKVNVADSQATDAEVAAAIAAQDAADSTEDRAILDNLRYQDGILHNPAWELNGSLVKAYTGATVGSLPRFLSIHTRVGHLQFVFPQTGEIVKGLGGLPNLTVDSNGFIPLPNSLWAALWYKYSGADQGWYYSSYTVAYDATVEYIRVIGIDYDGGVIGRLSNGSTIFQGMNYPDTNWLDLAPYFGAGVSNYGGGYRTARFRRQGNRVHLEGLALCPMTVGAVIATLPEGYRPKMQHLYTAQSNVGGTRVDVNAAGSVVVVSSVGSGGSGWTSLDGISFDLA